MELYFDVKEGTLEERFLGYVGVDSANILIVDPMFVIDGIYQKDLQGDIMDYFKRIERKPIHQFHSNADVELALNVKTKADGGFPVYGYFEEGHNGPKYVVIGTNCHY